MSRTWRLRRSPMAIVIQRPVKFSRQALSACLERRIDGLPPCLMAYFNQKAGRCTRRSHHPWWGGPEQVTQIEIHPSVGPTDARNAEKHIAVGVSDLRTLRT